MEHLGTILDSQPPDIYLATSGNSKHQCVAKFANFPRIPVVIVGLGDDIMQGEGGVLEAKFLSSTTPPKFHMKPEYNGFQMDFPSPGI